MTTDNTTSASPHRIIVGRKSPGPKPCKPEVTVERTGDLITTVVVKCCCSQEITINCHYESEDDANA